MPITLKNAAKADVVYSQYRVNGTRATYIGAEHDDLKKDQLVVLLVGCGKPTAQV